MPSFSGDSLGQLIPRAIGFQQILLREKFIMMKMKKCLFAVGLLSLAFAISCAKGGNGVVPEISVSISSPANLNAGDLYPNQSVTLAATVTGTSTQSVTWSVTGGGTVTSASALTATYVAPGAATTGVTVTATLTSDTSVTSNLLIGVVDITTEVTPATPAVGSGLKQQFTAIALPDDAPQTFTWTCTANGNPCKTFSQDPNVSGLAYYTAADNCTGSCIQISAINTLDPSGCTPTPKNCSIGKASIVTSRVNGTYAFQFSGYDSSNNAVAAAGTFTAVNGTITSGTEDELTSGGHFPHIITGGSYAPITSSNPNSNNAGALTLTNGAFPNKFQVTLNSAGDLSMIETDGHGTGSGIAQVAAGSGVFKGDQTYAFGFTGVDSSNQRVGYVGVLAVDGIGNITTGQIDVNDNGASTGICTASPCTVTGTYTAGQTSPGSMVITNGSVSQTFNFYISAGTAGKANPLTFYAISTDSPDSTHPAVAGTMVLQDSTQTYNASAFSGTSVSALTGTGSGGSNVSLTLGTTNGGGNFSGQFDQNNAGTIVSVPSTAPFSYTYAASGTSGRYTFQMLGNPNASPVVAPLPFVLYASGANRGFLLDQSSAVIAGTMSPQGAGSDFDPTELPGTYAATTTSSGTEAADPSAANILLTSSGGSTGYNVSGTQYQNQGSATVTGAYTLTTTGTGTIVLTAPGAQNYVIYVVDSSGCGKSSLVCTIEDFYMIDTTTGTNVNKNPTTIFAQQ
jgi:hypothetical protein